nr:hypothetical protein [Alkalinema sp. FACHB-956]
MTRTFRKVMVISKRNGQKLMRFVGKAVTRIFGPSDDDYPETGVQPFSGESAKGHS